jgi:predicted nucleic acid-binding protein
VGLIEAVGDGPVALDTSVFIYLIEEDPTYLRLIVPLFVAADLGNLRLVTSGVTLLEVLVRPYRAGNIPLAARYESLLTGSKGVDLKEIDRSQLRTAAQIRAVSPGVRAPDALQLAAALTEECSAFVTNDRRLLHVGGVRTILLSDFV